MKRQLYKTLFTLFFFIISFGVYSVESNRVSIENLLIKDSNNKKLNLLFLKSGDTKKKYQFIINNYLSNKDFYLKNEALAIELLDIIIKSEDVYVNRDIAQKLLTQKFWQEHERSTEWLETVMKSKDGYLNTLIIEKLLTQKFWQEHEKATEWLEKLMKSGSLFVDISVIESLLTQEFWQKHEKAAQWLDTIIAESRGSYGNIVEELLTQKFWQEHEKATEWFEILMKTYSTDLNIRIIENLLTQEFWQKHEKIIEWLDYLEFYWGPRSRYYHKDPRWFSKLRKKINKRNKKKSNCFELLGSVIWN